MFVFTNNLSTVNVRQVYSKVVQYNQVVDLVGVLEFYTCVNFKQIFSLTLKIGKHAT